MLRGECTRAFLSRYATRGSALRDTAAASGGDPRGNEHHEQQDRWAELGHDPENVPQQRIVEEDAAIRVERPSAEKAEDDRQHQTRCKASADSHIDSITPGASPSELRRRTNSRESSFMNATGSCFPSMR